jgi:DNA-binding NtrC family response regulator
MRERRPIRSVLTEATFDGRIIAHGEAGRGTSDMTQTSQARALDVGALVRTNLLGEAPAWKKVCDLVRRIAGNEAPTLVEGETGTGKELVARAIHYLGARRNFPFVPINCGALPDNLVESEFFGHERGAFTDARERRSGLVAEAQAGTLFLDEVEAMSPRAQVVLLRFLQDQTYLPVGGRAVITGDVRVIAASNAELDELVARGRFRRDLLFRLRVMHVRLPPLRERVGDVPLLANKFLERYCASYGRNPMRLSAASLASLEAHDWPGNVRELENLLLREFLLNDDESDELRLTAMHCNPSTGTPSAPPRFPVEFKCEKARIVAEFEKAYLRELFCFTRGNLSLAARVSRKDRATLKRLAKKHGIRTTAFREEEREPISER